MELSLFVPDAGIWLLETGQRDLLFLSLTDWVQHEYAPAESGARRFYAEIDRRFGRLAELGATLALTADHGMNDKSMPDGRPNVIWLQDILGARFGPGDTRVICPITDAFVAHLMLRRLLALRGVHNYHPRHERARLAHLPAARGAGAGDRHLPCAGRPALRLRDLLRQGARARLHPLPGQAHADGDLSRRLQCSRGPGGGGTSCGGVSGVALQTRRFFGPESGVLAPGSWMPRQRRKSGGVMAAEASYRTPASRLS
jgi:hypothetical protein